MPETIYHIAEPDVEEKREDIPGESLFSWKSFIFGILAGGSDYVDSVNQAIDQAYAER